jgi:hypothetical protein
MQTSTQRRATESTHPRTPTHCVLYHTLRKKMRHVSQLVRYAHISRKIYAVYCSFTWARDDSVHWKEKC